MYSVLIIVTLSGTTPVHPKMVHPILDVCHEVLHIASLYILADEMYMSETI